MERKRFKTTRICSSDNYEQSRDYYLRHTAEKTECSTSTDNKPKNKTAYVRVFGRLVAVNPREAKKHGYNVIWL